MLKTAIIILNWNGARYLEQFLPILIKNSDLPDAKIFVADNHSSDNSISLLKEKFPSVGIIHFSDNYGFAGGYNKAIEQIPAEYYVLINSDVEVTPDWLTAPLELLESDNKIAACMPKILSFDDRDSFEYAGAAGGFIDKFGYTFCRGRIFDTIERDNGQYNDTTEIFWATGACFFIKADLFKKAGMFDPTFFAHMEEVDLCWRLINSGYKILYTPNSYVYHVGGGTLPQNNPWKTFLNYRNNLLLLNKNLCKKNKIKILFIRLILDYLALIKLLLSADLKNAFAIIRAHIAFFKLKSDDKRDTNLVKFKSEYYIYPKSIVYSYFVKRIKYFYNLDFKITK